MPGNFWFCYFTVISCDLLLSFKSKRVHNYLACFGRNLFLISFILPTAGFLVIWLQDMWKYLYLCICRKYWVQTRTIFTVWQSTGWRGKYISPDRTRSELKFVILMAHKEEFYIGNLSVIHMELLSHRNMGTYMWLSKWLPERYKCSCVLILSRERFSQKVF